MHVSRPRAGKELQLVVAVVSLCCPRPVRTNAEIREGKEAARSASVRACTRRVQEKSHSAEACLRTCGSVTCLNVLLIPERRTPDIGPGILSSRTRRVLPMNSARWIAMRFLPLRPLRARAMEIVQLGKISGFVEICGLCGKLARRFAEDLRFCWTPQA